MKKIILTASMFSIMIMFQSSVKTQAETIGLSDIIFE